MKLKLAKRSVENTKGKVFYGVHMYPGVSEFGEGETLYVSDDVIRKMGPSMAGCPVYTYHKKPKGSVENVMREAAGVVESSFFNDADGQHWVKFIVFNSEAIRNIENGHGLSNGYDIVSEGPGGTRNGVDYDTEVLDGEFHHLAIVPNPRYESMILSPEEFKAYNDEKRAEVRRVANSKDDVKGKKMGLSLFKRTPVENSKDLEKMSVLLPKSGVEMTIADVVKAADKSVVNAKKPRVCNEDDIVVMEEAQGKSKEITIGELFEMIQSMNERIAELEAGEVGEIENEEIDEEVDEEVDEVENEDDEDDDYVENSAGDDEESAPRKGVKNSTKGKPAVLRMKAKDAKKVQNSAKAKAKALKARTANRRQSVENEFAENTVDTMASKMARGVSRYGSRS